MNRIFLLFSGEKERERERERMARDERDTRETRGRDGRETRERDGRERMVCRCTKEWQNHSKCTVPEEKCFANNRTNKCKNNMQERMTFVLNHD